MGAAGKPAWYVRLWHEGKERRFGAFQSKTKARELYEKAKLEQKEGRFFPERYHHGGHMKLKELIQGYMATNTKKTVKNDWCYARFWSKRFSEVRLNGINPEAIDQAKHDLSHGLSNQTVVHYLKFLRHVLNLAVKKGKLSRNPFAEVEMPKLSKGRLRFLSLDEEDRLLKAIGARYAPWVRFAILTGLRQGEQFDLKWVDIDLEGGLITLPHTKAGSIQYAPLSQEAKEILQNLESWQTSQWVFPSKNPGTPIDPFNFYHRTYLPALEQAELEGVTWHTLWHTFASRLAMSGATEQDIASCLRHSTTALVKRYAHLSQTHLKGVMEKVSAFGQSIPKPAISPQCVEKSEKITGEKNEERREDLQTVDTA
ncbi:MAG: site-specific integrase [Nitrospinae bacterium]|nr:site-specific integrase [Nitrospinota bacterium]